VDVSTNKVPARAKETSLDLEFSDMSENPGYWHNKATDLFTSAHVLWNAMDINENLFVSCDSTYKMLMGMSFEALLKGLCIESKKATIDELISHDLVKLTKITGLSLNKKESKALMLLSDYVKWAGKYPIPKSSLQLQQYRSMVASTTFDNCHFDNLKGSISNNALDYESLSPLWRRFSDVLISKTS